MLGLLQPRHAQRGQALVESAFFVPLLLIVLFGAMYFSQLSVLSQRMQVAIRYSANVAFANGSAPAYSAANIYTGTTGGGSVCASPQPGLLSNASPFPGPTTQPYWQPLSSPAPTSSCTQQTIDLGGASFLMARFLTQGNVQMSAAVPVPGILQAILGVTGGSDSISASAPWVHPAWPASIIACISKTATAEHDALTADETITLPLGWSPGSCNLKQ